jgi:hypothetical protein
MPPGLSLTTGGVLSGMPTLATSANILFTVTDSANPPNTVNYNFPVIIDNAGNAEGIGLAASGSLDTVELSYQLTSVAPSAVPINVTATTGSIPFTAAVSGMPGLSLSSASGTAPTTLNMNLNIAGLTAGVYPGVLAVEAPTASNLAAALPVVLTVTSAPPCAYTLGPNSNTIESPAGNLNFTVYTGTSCSWTATTSDSFLTIDPATASGTGQGLVQFSITVNSGTAARAGHITVGGQTFTITQFGSSCSLSLTPSSIPATAAGGTAQVQIVTTNLSCPWTASGSSGLSQLTPSGTGSGQIFFTILPSTNQATQTLTETVTITGGPSATVTVTQSGTGCTTGLSAPNAEIGYSGAPLSAPGQRNYARRLQLQYRERPELDFGGLRRDRQRTRPGAADLYGVTERLNREPERNADYRHSAIHHHAGSGAVQCDRGSQRLRQPVRKRRRRAVPA